MGEALGLKDTILDISITPNRPDCLCVIGVAREIAALTHQKVRYPASSLSDQGRGDPSENLCDHSGSRLMSPLCGEDDRWGEDWSFSRLDEKSIGKGGDPVYQQCGRCDQLCHDGIWSATPCLRF